MLACSRARAGQAQLSAFRVARARTQAGLPLTVHSRSPSFASCSVSCQSETWLFVLGLAIGVTVSMVASYVLADQSNATCTRQPIVVLERRPIVTELMPSVIMIIVLYAVDDGGRHAEEMELG